MERERERLCLTPVIASGGHSDLLTEHEHGKEPYPETPNRVHAARGNRWEFFGHVCRNAHRNPSCDESLRVRDANVFRRRCAEAAATKELAMTGRESPRLMWKRAIGKYLVKNLATILIIKVITKHYALIIVKLLYVISASLYCS
jgi:hypothetical protein